MGSPGKVWPWEIVKETHVLLHKEVHPEKDFVTGSYFCWGSGCVSASHVVLGI